MKEEVSRAGLLLACYSPTCVQLGLAESGRQDFDWPTIDVPKS